MRGDKTVPSPATARSRPKIVVAAPESSFAIGLCKHRSTRITFELGQTDLPNEASPQAAEASGGETVHDAECKNGSSRVPKDTP
jgi:hypothetical protein